MYIYNTFAIINTLRYIRFQLHTGNQLELPCYTSQNLSSFHNFYNVLFAVEKGYVLAEKVQMLINVRTGYWASLVQQWTICLMSNCKNLKWLNDFQYPVRCMKIDSIRTHHCFSTVINFEVAKFCHDLPHDPLFPNNNFNHIFHLIWQCYDHHTVTYQIYSQ